jgi:hypothetical protein
MGEAAVRTRKWTRLEYDQLAEAEILGRKLGERVAWVPAAPDDPAEWLAYWLDIACRDTDWVRLMQWEALEGGAATVTREVERDRASRRGIAAPVRENLAPGFLRH